MVRLQKVIMAGTLIGITALVFSLVFASCATKPQNKSNNGNSISFDDIEGMYIVDIADIKNVKVDANTDNEDQLSDLDIKGAQKYEVAEGDTLSRIALNQYDSTQKTFYFPLIMLDSENVVRDPELIGPGNQIKIPDLTQNLADPKARESVRDFLLRLADIYKKADKYPGTEARLRALADSLNAITE